MKTLLILLIALICGAMFMFHQQPESSKLFSNYQRQWNKSYANQEVEEYRRTIFYENVADIESHNAIPGVSYLKGINQFTDLTNEECVMLYLGDNGPDATNYNQEIDRRVNGSPDIDWREKGKISPVKDQGSCGSCYSFGAVANIESLNLIFGTQKLVQYAEQMLVDCSGAYGNNGCGGGLATNAFKFVIDKGIVTQEEYPYIARAQKCKIETGPLKLKDFKMWDQKGCDELELQMQTQPVAIRAYAQNWFSYSSGIFDKCTAPAGQYGHAVFMPAFSAKQGYWVIKNSWGAKWGEQGFIRLKHPGSCCNICGCFSTGVL